MENSAFLNLEESEEQLCYAAQESSGSTWASFSKFLSTYYRVCQVLR